MLLDPAQKEELIEKIAQGRKEYLKKLKEEFDLECDQIVDHQKLTKNDYECCICLYVVRMPIRCVRCKHLNCLDCISLWANGLTKNCPNCRQDFEGLTWRIVDR